MKTKKENIIIKTIGKFPLFVTLLFIIFLIAFTIYNNKGCYQEPYILEKQDLNNDYGYLMMNVLKINPHKKERVTFYFEKEFNLRQDLKENDIIIVSWCYVPEIQDYRIREIMRNEKNNI